MAYINNQYIRLDKSIEEIAKLEIKTDDNNQMIEDLEITEYQPNIIIAYGEKVRYENIYSSVKILITDKKAIENNDYIPEYIETIIIYRYIYGNNKREIERLKLGLKNGNELILAIKGKNEEKILELVKETEINLNLDYNGKTALWWACRNNMSEVAIKLIDRMSDEIINKWNDKGETVLWWASYYKMSEVAKKLIDRMSDGAINKWNDYNETALYWACYGDMTEVAIKLVERMSEEAINKKSNKKSALYWACRNNMTEVAIKLRQISNFCG